MKQHGDLIGRLGRGLLAPLAGAYGAAVSLRNRYYDRVPGASRAAGVPVISVGNLTVGGTGKTPMVIEIVRRLLALGRRPAILTRGYGGRAGAPADEVREFGLALPDVPVVVNPDRVAGAAVARARYAADGLVLDDGFQHRRLRRDLDIVLVDALSPWGGGGLLPAGRLREPPSALRRAHCVVLTRTNQAGAQQVRDLVAVVQRVAPGAAVLRGALETERLVGPDGAAVAPAALAGRRVLPVCGIGNPQTFLRQIERLGADCCRPRLFPDHRRYTQADVRDILAAAREPAAEWVVTTRKDWVKLAALWPAPGAAGGLPLYRLEVRVTLADPRGEFDVRLRKLFEERT